MNSRWYVAETRPQCERLAEWHLKSLGYPTLLPKISRRRTFRNAVLVDACPLFPGYMFVAFDRAVQRWRGLNSVKGVKRILGNDPENPMPLSKRLAAELLDRFAVGPLDIPAAVAAIEIGAQITITDGPLVGKHGECVWSDAQRCRLLISLLGRQHVVGVPIEWVSSGAEVRRRAEAI